MMFNKEKFLKDFPDLNVAVAWMNFPREAHPELGVNEPHILFMLADKPSVLMNSQSLSIATAHSSYSRLFTYKTFTYSQTDLENCSYSIAYRLGIEDKKELIKAEDDSHILSLIYPNLPPPPIDKLYNIFCKMAARFGNSYSANIETHVEGGNEELENLLYSKANKAYEKTLAGSLAGTTQKFDFPGLSGFFSWKEDGLSITITSYSIRQRNACINSVLNSKILQNTGYAAPIQRLLLSGSITLNTEVLLRRS